jgi:hypothetical protein
MALERRNRAVRKLLVEMVRANPGSPMPQPHYLLCPRWEAKAWLDLALSRNVLRRGLARLQFPLLRLPVEGLERQASVRSLARIPNQFRPQT